MEQELRFGLDLGLLALLEKQKIWADYEHFLRLLFYVFMGKKIKDKHIVASPRDILIECSK